MSFHSRERRAVAPIRLSASSRPAAAAQPWGGAGRAPSDAGSHVNAGHLRCGLGGRDAYPPTHLKGKREKKTSRDAPMPACAAYACVPRRRAARGGAVGVRL